MLSPRRYSSRVTVGLLLIASGSLSPGPARALSLQPVEEAFQLDGVPFKHWVFPAGATKITYTPPTNWRLVGNPASAMLYPPDGTIGEVKIVQLPAPKDRTITKPVLDLMSRNLRGSLPPESKDVSDLEPQVNPVPVQDVPTGEVICTYSAFGQKFKRATLVLNHPNYQLNFTLTAATNVFDRLHAEWMRSMFSWEWQPAH